MKIISSHANELPGSQKIIPPKFLPASRLFACAICSKTFRDFTDETRLFSKK
ncbi:MAG: hypothetical protein HC800_17955 [Phormidesmis sp. RL_2_1]|nr:hypothetical protein [Phormidesmis sp. RL_2_1]